MSNDTSTVIGTWSIGPANRTPAESSFLIGRVTTSEASFGDDGRKPVDPADRMPGGKYYSIVKLQIHYEGQDSNDTRYAQGTGWLIKPDLLVTAGHCVFDHTYHFGRATEVKAYLGYNGKSSIGTKGVQFRTGRKLATTKAWLSSDINRDGDVGFIQLDKPFDNVEIFDFSPTEVRNTKVLEVVGYPADKKLGDETGAQMYQMSKEVTWDLDKTTLHMLEYTISTYAGQSGSPVLIKGKKQSIGAHVYGLLDTNSASVIRGTYGNYYKALALVFTQKFPSTLVNNVSYMTVPSEKQEDDFEPVAPTDAEDFWDTLKGVANTAANIGQKVLQVGSPFLGPIGGPIAAVAGTALGFVGKMTESSLGDEAGPHQATEYKDQCYKAVASEAALQTVLKMNMGQLQKYGIFDKMQGHYVKNRKNIPALAKAIGPALLEPAVRIAVLNTSPDAVKQNDSALPIVAVPPGTESSMDDDRADRLVKVMKEEAHAKGMEEGFLDFLGPIIKTAVQVAPIGLKIVGGLLGSGGEAAFDAKKDTLQPHYEAVCHRALMGDAALQAILAIPPEQLKAEGFFGDMLGTIKNIGATVIKTAPGVIRTVLPIVTAIVNKTGPAAAVGNVSSSLDIETASFAVEPSEPIHKVSLLDALNKPHVLKQFTEGGNINGSNGTNGTNGYPNGDRLQKQRDGLAW